MTDPTTPVARTWCSPPVVFVDDNAHLRVTPPDPAADQVTLQVNDGAHSPVLTVHLSALAANGLRHLLNVNLAGAEALVPVEWAAPSWAARDLARFDPDPLVGVAVGDPFMGGFFAGVIDTTVGNIITADASQGGVRYALVVASIDLEQESLQFKTTYDLAPPAARTRWDGLAATAAMAEHGSFYPAAHYCDGLDCPDDGGSPWYLPALDELELVYRGLKPTGDENYPYTSTSSAFPGTQASGFNPSSDPAGVPYTDESPAQTQVAAFGAAGAQWLSGWYWCATEFSATSAWYQDASGGPAGDQVSGTKSNSSRVRPVRRLAL